MANLEHVDRVLKNLLKQNAALLELVAYGSSVYPREEEFQAEHNRFVGSLSDVLKTGDFFVVSVIEDEKRELKVLSTFNPTQPKPQETQQPAGGGLQLLLNHTGSASELAAQINTWKHRGEVFILPYVVRLNQRIDEVIREQGGVLKALSVFNRESALDSIESAFDEFLDTNPTSPGSLATDPITGGYFRAFACVGIGKSSADYFKKAGVSIPLLLETLMIFYQMSWSHREVVRRNEQKANQVRNQDMAEMYTMTREPVERLVIQLQAALRPLNELQSILTPVRGLFGANIVDEKFFRQGPQRFKLRDEEPVTIEIAHEFGAWGGPRKEQLDLAGKQIAAVVLQAFGELENAKRPLWQYMIFNLRFGQRYRSVASFLLQNHEALLDHGLTTFRDSDEVDKIYGETERLFKLVKYWFHRAGRTRRAMRADYLSAGLGLLFPRDSGRTVVTAGVDEGAAFWVVSRLPVDTLAGLEALCHAYGELEAARLKVEPADATTAATLVLTFSATAAKDPARTKLGPVIESCKDSEDEVSLNRGNMAFALLNVFGGIPLRDGGPDEPGKKEREGGTLSLRNDSKTAVMKFEEHTIEIEWSGPTPTPDDL